MSERPTVSALTPINTIMSGGGVVGSDVSADIEKLRSELSELRAQVFSSEQQLRKHIDKGVAGTQKLLVGLDQKPEKFLHPDSDSSDSDSEKEKAIELRPRRASTYAAFPRNA